MNAVRIGALDVVVEARPLLDLDPRPDAFLMPDDGYLTHSVTSTRSVWEAAGSRLVDAAPQGRPLPLGTTFEATVEGLGATVFVLIASDLDRNARLRPNEIVVAIAQVLLAADAGGSRTLAVVLPGGEAAVEAVVEGLASVADKVLRNLKRVIVISEHVQERGRVVTALHERSSAPRLAILVRAAADRAPTKVKRAMAAAASRLDSGEHGWAQVSLLEAALQALGADALEEADGRMPPGGPAGTVLESMDGSVLRRLTRPDGRLAKEFPPALGPGQLLVAVRTLRKNLGRVLPATLDTALQSAVDARNRFAHGDGPMEAVHELDASLVVIYEHLARPSSPTSTRASSGHVLDTGVSPSSTTGPPNTSPVAPRATARADLSDGAHVRALAAFLREKLSTERRRELDDELTARGYAGEPDLKLLEHIVRHEDPARWVAEELPVSVLRKELQSRVGAPPSPDLPSQHLAERILETLGFPAVRRAQGLATAIVAIQKAKPRIHAASENEVRGLALSCASHVERTVLVLLRFICRAGFGLPPELYFRRNHPSLIVDDRPLDRTSLGTLFMLLERLADDFANGTAPQLLSLKQDLGSERIVPKNAIALANLRNDFAHFREESETLPLADLRRRALAFADASLALLQYFERSEVRVFPRVIRVKLVRTDAWHRRVVEAEDELGHAEFIFTSRSLEPGAVYYMHSLTNPFRVDPILVEAGDLASDH